MEKFFNNRNLIVLIDTLCQRYGKLPHEVFCGLTINDFSFDMAIMIVADIEEKKKNNKVEDTSDWKKFGIDRTVIDKRGENK